MRSQNSNPSSARARLFFAHQSVGENLLSGLRELNVESKAIRVHAMVRPDEQADPSATLLHARLGTNGKPTTKLDEFAAWLRAGIADRIECALLKFCYVDVLAPTAADELFAAYTQSMARIRASHPHLRIVHCTVPLRAVPGGPYAALRRALGHRHAEYERNAARERFNELLRRSIAREDLFDIARIEAGLDGYSGPRDESAQDQPAMLRKYTSDGGHLNEQGRRIVATQFAKFFDGLTPS